MFILNPQSGTPIYRQLIEQVRRLVASGQLEPGTPLPSVRELAQEHAVNPMTISKAYNLLEIEGLLTRNRGKPMTVAQLRRRHTPLTARLKQIDEQVEQLVLAARQLELQRKDVMALINNKWGEDEDDRTSRQRNKA